MSAYDHPLYYEIAFSYQQAKKQVDFFEKVGQHFCKRKPRRFLDIGCGPSLQLREIARRGYEAIGLDINPHMLAYLKQKATEEGLAIETVQADMRSFKLEKKCDFAFNLSGSLYVRSNREFLEHLKCVSNALNPTGIYLLENVTIEMQPHGGQEWTMKRDDIEVKTTWEAILIDPVEQICREKLVLAVNDHWKQDEFMFTADLKEFAPQELKSLTELSGHFRFLGFFRHLSLEPLRQDEKDNVAIMQKK